MFQLFYRHDAVLEMKQIHQQLYPEEEQDSAVWDLCVLDLRDVSLLSFTQFFCQSDDYLESFEICDCLPVHHSAFTSFSWCSCLHVILHLSVVSVCGFVPEYRCLFVVPYCDSVLSY